MVLNTKFYSYGIVPRIRDDSHFDAVEGVLEWFFFVFFFADTVYNFE